MTHLRSYIYDKFYGTGLWNTCAIAFPQQVSRSKVQIAGIQMSRLANGDGLAMNNSGSLPAGGFGDVLNIINLFNQFDLSTNNDRERERERREKN